MIHINLNMNHDILYTCRVQYYQNNLHKVLYGKTNTAGPRATHTRTHARTHTHTTHTHTHTHAHTTVAEMGTDISWDENTVRRGRFSVSL